MPLRRKHILHVSLPVPLRRNFDYLSEDSIPDQALVPGTRLKVPFGKSKVRTGVLIGKSDKSDLPADKLKRVLKTIDEEPLLSNEDMKLLLWASNYYQHPLGEVIFNALPAMLRQGKTANINKEVVYQLTPAGKQVSNDVLQRAPVQKLIIELLKTSPNGFTHEYVKEKKWNSTINTLLRKNYIERLELNRNYTAQIETGTDFQLNEDQKKAVITITGNSDKYHCILLEGVTGSGKTEVYIELIKYFKERGLQSLILVPEIGLTPQLAKNFSTRLGMNISVLHSGLSDGERMQAWLLARTGNAPVILGTRSAVWTPLKFPGVIIIDEEHDLSYKQHDGFRYSARDVAIMRGKMNDIPVVLGSATPSMESLYNAVNNKYIHLKLENRAGVAKHPAISLIDLRSQKMTGAFSEKMLNSIEEELKQGHQILLFLNKRGFSPVLMCHLCGWAGKCNRCNVHMAYHKREDILSCHHCGTQKKLPAECPECHEDDLIQVGHGTERLTETLAEFFPGARIMRIDRDSTRRKGAMEKMVNKIRTGEADILVGTQMLAKGHDFPNVNLVGILDADRGLFSMDFRASEHLAQLIIQVSGRAGRASDKGRVFIQTHYPHHPLLRTLIESGYQIFSGKILEERKEADLPPYSYQVLLRADDYKKETSEMFLKEAKLSLPRSEHIEIYGPFPAPLEKRAGRFRYQLLVQSDNRNHLLRTITPWVLSLESLSSGKKVRWSVDVDPLENL